MKRALDSQDQVLRTYGLTFSFKSNVHKVMVDGVGVKCASDCRDQGLRTYGSTFSFKSNGHRVMVDGVGGYFFGPAF